MILQCFVTSVILATIWIAIDRKFLRPLRLREALKRATQGE